MPFVKDLKVHVHAPDGTSSPVEAPPSLKTGQFLRELVGAFGLSSTVHWSVHDGDIDRTLDNEKSLEENGVCEGHHLHLREHQRPEAGVGRGEGEAPPPPRVHEQHGQRKEPEGKKPTAEEKPVLKRCENGHFYDPAKHTTCPYCGVSDIEIEPTTPKTPKSIKIGPPVPEEGLGRTRAAGQPPPRVVAPQTDEITRAVTPGGPGIDPVVGWLVCTHGREKGKDYRIRSENNTIGRSSDMYICISGDDSISRERHAIITFDPQTNSFYLWPGEGRGLAYLNGKALFKAEQLQPYDEILLGKTKLLFAPLCGDRFKWE